MIYKRRTLNIYILDSDQPNSGYIYVMSRVHENNIMKIGLSKDPLRRAGELHRHSGSPSRLLIDHVWAVSNMRRAEWIAHDKFKMHRVDSQREFFYLVPPHTNYYAEKNGMFSVDDFLMHMEVVRQLIEEHFDYYNSQVKNGVMLPDCEELNYRYIGPIEANARLQHQYRIFGDESVTGF